MNRNKAQVLYIGMEWDEQKCVKKTSGAWEQLVNCPASPTQARTLANHCGGPASLGFTVNVRRPDRNSWCLVCPTGTLAVLHFGTKLTMTTTLHQQQLRTLLLERASALCQAFATKQPVDAILEHFSDDITCFEHGLPRLAPFLGRSFTGTIGARAYFELIGDLLDFENMSFSDYMVDTETRQVSVLGRATFRYKATGKRWKEVFTYRLGFSTAPDSKISSYQVWADSGAAHWASLPRRVVLVTYEFTYSPFSGNGILSRSIVKALLRECCHVTVWCCQPFLPPQDSRTANHHLIVPEITLEQYERLTLIPLQLQAQHGWRKLDDQSAWKYFCYENLNASSQQLLKHCIETADVVCAVDWTGAHALRSFVNRSNCASTNRPRPSTVYFNFRVYSSGIRDQARHAWFDDIEQQALKDADTVIVLSERDRVSLQSIVGESQVVLNTTQHVLLPPLRGDVHDLALRSTDELITYLPASVAAALQRDGGKETIGNRRLLTCVARISPEKNVLRFVHFLEQAERVFNEHDNAATPWIPLLAGAAPDPEYATLVKNELARVAPHAIIIDHFLDPTALCAIFAVTALNFHPCAYDAYGMTAVEAAACGVPSVIAREGVGATALLQNAFIPVEMPVQNDTISNEAVQLIVKLLEDPEQLQSIGKAAQEKALAWDEKAYGRKLLDIFDSGTNKE